MPVIRILTGAQPLSGASSDEFVLHFAPYFGWALLTVAVAGAGTYTFGAFALGSASFWIHAQATVLTALRRRGRFVVTPKRGERRRQLRPVWPALAMIALLAGAVVAGLARAVDPGTLNNVAFALVHLAVLLTGIWPALVPRATERPAEQPPPATSGRAAAPERAVA
ncbi:MAG: hypothetical protein ACLGHP_11050, partial [Vicinamibacteria bacterium]